MSEKEDKRVNGAVYKRISALEDDLSTLKKCFAKVCHMAGTEKNLTEYGIEKWVPGKNDMTKYKD